MITQRHDISGNTYQSIWDFQTLLHDSLKIPKIETPKTQISAKSKAKKLNHIVFCEHNNVITFGKSASTENLLSSEDTLRDENIEFYKINRGGDVTYHGPGQLTGYLIVDVELLYRDIHKYVRNIEECIIRLLELYGIKGIRREAYTGVWISDELGARKICAIGVHLSRWVSMHGFGFNINTKLENFNHIIPCGIQEKASSVTSLAQELGQTQSMDKIKDQLQIIIEDVFDMKIV